MYCNLLARRVIGMIMRLLIQLVFKGYSYTKNLAPSPLQINANTVTFNGAVGSIKALSTLTVTAPTVNINGGAITTGAQVYSSGTTNRLVAQPIQLLLILVRNIPNCGPPLSSYPMDSRDVLMSLAVSRAAHFI